MKDLHHSLTTSKVETTSKSKKPTKQSVKKSRSINQNIDEATIKKNVKVDVQLLSDFYRRVDASRGAIQRARGAKYRLSHPLGSNDVPNATIPNEKK